MAKFKISKRSKKGYYRWGVAGAVLVVAALALLTSAATAPQGETWGEWATAWTTLRKPEQPTPKGHTQTWGEWAGSAYDSLASSAASVRDSITSWWTGKPATATP